jgi:hypothetical protein
VSQPDLEPLSPELARLLAAEKTRPDPSVDMQARVLARFGGEFLDAPPSLDPGAAAAAPPDLTPLVLHRLPLAVTMLAIGGLGGAAIHANLRKPVQTTVYVPIPAAPVEPLPKPELLPDTPEPEHPPASKIERRRDPAPRRPSTPTPSTPPPTAPAAAPAEAELQRVRDRELAAERGLIEQARTALARGKAPDALVLLARHQREFARGQLVEEREALEILSLAATNQTAAARVRAAGFRQVYPKSMLLRSIDAALSGAP